MSNTLSVEDFQHGISSGLNLPEKHDNTEEVQLFSVESPDPDALDNFLKLFGAYLVRRDDGEFARLDTAYIIYTVTNGPYIYQMVMENGLGQNIKTLEFKE